MEPCKAPLTNAEQVVNAYKDTVYRLAYAMVHSKSDADDVFQEVFLRYFRKQPALESRDHQKAWLIRVTVNCAKKHLSSAWMRKTAPLPESLPLTAPEETGLAEALEKLPPLYRSVIHLHYYEGYRTDEVAALLCRTPAAVRKQLLRARALLATSMEEEASHA